MGAMALVRSALPQGTAVDLGRPEVVDDHLLRSGEYLDPFLAGHRRGAAVRDRRDRAVREPQRHRHSVVPLRPVAAQNAHHVLDVGSYERLCEVDEMAYLAEQAPALAPVQIPVAV